MDIAAKKLELMQQIMSIMDADTLRHVSDFFKKEVFLGTDNNEDITDEEYAEFEEMRARRDKGEIKFQTEEESMEEIRRIIDKVRT
jgi:hypothetical protein